MNHRERIAWKIAQDLEDGEFVSFGHGIPYAVGKYIDPRKQIYIQIEPGVVCFGLGTPAEPGDYEMRDSMNRFVTDNVGGSFFDTVSSFCMIRGNHLDKTILGAYQADSQGNFANWKLPSEPASGIGGAMDLAVGAKQVILAMEMTTKTGEPKLIERCTYPLTGLQVVSKIYTEAGVFEVDPQLGFVLTERFSDHTLEDISAKIGAPFQVSGDLKTIAYSDKEYAKGI